MKLSLLRLEETCRKVRVVRPAEALRVVRINHLQCIGSQGRFEETWQQAAGRASNQLGATQIVH